MRQVVVQRVQFAQKEGKKEKNPDGKKDKNMKSKGGKAMRRVWKELRQKMEKS